MKQCISLLLIVLTANWLATVAAHAGTCDIDPPSELTDVPRQLWLDQAQFSFLVGIPTMLAASGLKIYKALLRPLPGAVPEDWGAVALGFVVAAVVSFVAVKWLLGYIRTHTFTPFGWYRIAVGVLILVFLR